MQKNVLVGIRIDSQSRDLLSWALVKVAEPGDCVVAVHVSRSSGMAFHYSPQNFDVVPHGFLLFSCSRFLRSNLEFQCRSCFGREVVVRRLFRSI